MWVRALVVGAVAAAVIVVPAGAQAAALDGYDGIYASHVRFAIGTVAGRREFARIELLDGAGRLLYRDRFLSAITSRATPRPARARRIAGRAGAPGLWQTSSRCLALTAGPRPSAEEACATIRFGATTVLLDASCATRRLTVAVATTPGTRVLADTGAGAPRRVALRAGAGLLTLAPATALRALTFIHGSVTERISIDAPPGARQCGWSAEPQIG